MVDVGVAEDIRSDSACAPRAASHTTLQLILDTFKEKIRKLEDAVPDSDAVEVVTDLIRDNEVLEENIQAYDAALREVIEHAATLRAQNAALTVHVACIPELERLLAQERESFKELALENQSLTDKNAELLAVMQEALACDDGFAAASAHYCRREDSTRQGALYDEDTGAEKYDALKMDNAILRKENDMLRNLLFGIYGRNENQAN